MKPLTDLPLRLKPDAPGFGQASQRDIVRRAAEIARIDGREVVTQADLLAAENELETSGETPSAPEVPPSLEQVTATDSEDGSVVVQDGQRIAPVPLEDDANIALRLVQQGLEEADHDIRLTADDEDQEDSETARE
jgi:hypothetical protein